MWVVQGYRTPAPPMSPAVNTWACAGQLLGLGSSNSSRSSTITSGGGEDALADAGSTKQAERWRRERTRTGGGATERGRRSSEEEDLEDGAGKGEVCLPRDANVKQPKEGLCL